MKVLRDKLSIWISLQNKNGNLKLLIIATLTWLVCFIKPIVGKTYTSWDTHDLGFVNFLYFSDSLRQGIFPLWNHFLQAGTFFPSFNNAGLYSPFQLFFVALSWMINPVYAYELMIQFAVLIGGIGSYLLFRTYTNERLIALFGATAFAAVVLVPIVGQIGFVVSLSSFPWIILACINIERGRGGPYHYIALGAIGALYVVSGYLWMNIINLLIAAVFSIGLFITKFMGAETKDKKALSSKVKNLFFLLGTASIIYGCLELPGYLSMQFNYELFSGNYASPEPRLRSINIQAQYHSYGNISQALIAAIDPRIYINNEIWVASLHRWSYGAGWVLWICFLVFPTRRPFGQPAFWMALLLVALMYSAGNGNFLGNWVRHLPIINANRWWILGIFYVTTFLIIVVVGKILSLKEAVSCAKHDDAWRLPLVGITSLYLLVHFKSSAIEFGLLAIGLGLVWLLAREKDQIRWERLLIVLMGFNVLSIASMQFSYPENSTYLPNTGPDSYSQQVSARAKEVFIAQNTRQLGKGHDYIYNDEEWLLKKMPFSHGYNNLGNPYYWYVKNEPFLERLVVVTQNVRQEKIVERSNYASDNKFVETMMSDVLADMGTPTIDAPHFLNVLHHHDFKWQLNELRIEPNMASMRVTIDAAAYLIFNNVDHPGWEVYVNGKKTELIRANRIFQGVFLEGAGSYDVVFKFRPMLTVTLLLLPYIVLFLCLIAYWQKKRKRGKLHAN
ncbi:MAG: hypothetical protein Q8S21_04020 [Candidatus Paracaedibacteraceae bacterium]|nr:hypothetical protein [Candidatus Paracaedibacteraceae bacterium]